MATEYERKAQMISKINDEIVKNGFKSLTMDNMSKIMGISRGKLYQYFASKDEVIEAVVARYIRFIEEKSMIGQPDNHQGYVDEFVSIFFQNIILASSASDVFVNDLKEIYPDLYHSFTESMTKRQAAIENFYDAGITHNVFNQGMNTRLLHLQDQTMLSLIVLPAFLFKHRLEPAQVMRDYLHLRVTAVIAPPYQHLVNQEHVDAQIKHLDEKFRRVMWMTT
ncbi:TetR/AcrR family transcriptional regulator [Paenibacillus paeoniae]|uniref:TetR/AcrR family transcriptional regulator n=1 Tax=Paenibacillus paeoniae TaxID=2292705 RepID=A0A371P7Y1_9BACL|nr:TetR/AcrR family transcriptional regulator [Paenibacillus paeoniae]REK71628.1 TetR/AcrR family transcriptional regulator [Paenibacillus paeoniae]